MKNQVLSVKQMQELIALGIDASTASMCWLGCSNGKEVYPYNSTFRDVYENHKDTFPKVLTPTFTLQDILHKISKYTLSKITNDVYVCHTYVNGLVEHRTNGKTELEAAFNMLKWCIEMC